MNNDMISDAGLEQKLQQSPRPRVTKEYMKSRIREVTWHRTTPTLTTAVLTLDNGFFVTGEAACVNPENYNADIATKISFDNAFAKLWPLFGFLLAEAQGRMPEGEFARIEYMFPAWAVSKDSDGVQSVDAAATTEGTSDVTTTPAGEPSLESTTQEPEASPGADAVDMGDTAPAAA